MHDRQWQLVEQFLQHLGLERRLSPHTVKSYRRDLTCFRAFCDKNDIDRWNDLSIHHLRRFAAQSHAQGLSPRSIQRRLSGVRSFMNYLIREGETLGADALTHNPVTDVSAPKAARKLPNTLDIEQMGRLLDIRGDDPVTKRDRAMLELFYSSGLRLAELVGLDPQDVDFDDSVVLLMVSTRQVGPATQISVNLRAPIVLDAHNRRAWQYVMPNSTYSVRQVIATAQPKDG